VFLPKFESSPSQAEHHHYDNLGTARILAYEIFLVWSYELSIIGFLIEKNVQDAYPRKKRIMERIARDNITALIIKTKD
jgi:hypothetical protein